MKDKYHKVVNGKTVAINLPKQKPLSEKDKKEIRKLNKDLTTFFSRFI